MIYYYSYKREIGGEIIMFFDKANNIVNVIEMNKEGEKLYFK